MSPFLPTACLFLGAPALAQSDWPMWGRTEERNMVSPEKNLPADFSAGKFKGTSEEIDPATTRNVKWIAKLGSQCYGNPTVSGGRVFVGTNNDAPRDPRYTGDRSCLYCFDEQTGAFLWQLNVPKLGTGKVSDWEYLGICSSAAVEGDRVYVATNRCEVACLDADGLADGNDGPFTDEGKYYAGAGKPPLELQPSDADILWLFNMTDECGVFPHNITANSVLIVGERLWTATSNGVDFGHVETPAPNAPSLICLDKSGKLLGEEASGIGHRIFHSNWTSPSYLRSAGLVLFGGPDGVCYAFEPEAEPSDDGRSVLKEAWRVDCNPPEYRVKDGKPIKYATRYGPSELLATPVVCEGRIYCAIGQDPEHGEGVGNLVCIDPSGKPLWHYQEINRSLSTPAVAGGLLFTADFSGFVYCLDAASGAEHWKHDTKGHIWGSPLCADGKLYIGNEDGYLTILPARKEYRKEDVVEIEMGSPVYSSPIAANGVLYVATHTHLFAIGGSKP